MPHVNTGEFLLDAGGGRLLARSLSPIGKEAERLPTMVFLHEGLGSIAQWRDFPEALVARTGLPALAYDRRGHGGSDPLNAPRSAHYLHREALEVLPEVLARCNLEDTIL